MEGNVRIGLDAVGQHFESLEDPRSEINLRHPLVSVVVIALMAVLAGADGPTAIAKWAQLKSDLLLKQLDLPNGVPRKDVFRRVLSALNPAAFQVCFASWLQSLQTQAVQATGIEQPILAVDGKTLRRSHDRRKGLGALHSVSVWASDFGLTLAQVACEQKSNEITAIPEVLKLVTLKGAIITIDAMGQLNGTGPISVGSGSSATHTTSRCKATSAISSTTSTRWPARTTISTPRPTPS